MIHVSVLAIIPVLKKKALLFDSPSYFTLGVLKIWRNPNRADKIRKLLSPSKKKKKKKEHKKKTKNPKRNKIIFLTDKTVYRLIWTSDSVLLAQLFPVEY